MSSVTFALLCVLYRLFLEAVVCGINVFESLSMKATYVCGVFRMNRWCVFKCIIS